MSDIYIYIYIYIYRIDILLRVNCLILNKFEQEIWKLFKNHLKKNQKKKTPGIFHFNKLVLYFNKKAIKSLKIDQYL